MTERTYHCGSQFTSVGGRPADSLPCALTNQRRALLTNQRRRRRFLPLPSYEKKIRVPPLVWAFSSVR